MLCKNCNADMSTARANIVHAEISEEHGLDLIIECEQCEQRYNTFVAQSDFVALDDD